MDRPSLCCWRCELPINHCAEMKTHLCSATLPFPEDTGRAQYCLAPQATEAHFAYHSAHQPQTPIAVYSRPWRTNTELDGTLARDFEPEFQFVEDESSPTPSSMDSTAWKVCCPFLLTDQPLTASTCHRNTWPCCGLLLGNLGVGKPSRQHQMGTEIHWLMPPSSVCSPPAPSPAPEVQDSRRPSSRNPSTWTVEDVVRFVNDADPQALGPHVELFRKHV